MAEPDRRTALTMSHRVPAAPMAKNRITLSMKPAFVALLAPAPAPKEANRTRGKQMAAAQFAAALAPRP
jgi:hypothetical protein